MPDPFAQSALVGVYRPGRFGALKVGVAPGVTLTERHPFEAVQVAAQKGSETRTVDVLTRTLGFAPPAPNRAAGSGAGTLLWVGPERWLAVGPKGHGLYRRLRGALAEDTAAVVDLSQARTCIHVAGPNSRAVLAKGCVLDFHPRARPAGHVAQSPVASINAIIHVVETATAFDLYVARGFAISFWEWLADASAEFGYEVTAKGA